MIVPNEWPSVTAVPVRPRASMKAVSHFAKPSIECGTSVSGVDSPKPGMSGPIQRMPGRCAITGSSP
jgi:hypothetical protein